MDKQTKIIIAVSSVVVLGGAVALYLYLKPKPKNDFKDLSPESKKVIKESFNKWGLPYTPKDTFLSKSGDGTHIIKLSNSQMIEVKESGLTEEDLQRMEYNQSGIFTK